MARAVAWRDVWHQRLAAHSLSEPAPAERLVDVVGAVCGIHAQVAPSAELSVCLRVAGITQPDVRAALWTERSLVKTYGLRGTLHIFPTRELPMWLAALREKVSPRASPAQQAALPLERVDDVVGAMRDALDGQQLTREELGQALARRLGAWANERTHPAFGGHMPPWQMAQFPAALAGVLAFGPNRCGRITYVRLDQWVGELPAVDGRAALQEICRRFVRAYGPTTHVELARWLYTTPAAARELLHSLGDELEEVDVDGWPAYGTRTLLFETPTPARTVHLVPRFDCYIVGCHPRKQLIPEAAPGALQGGTADQRRLLDGEVERMGAFYGVQVEGELGHVEPRGHM